MLSVFEGLVDPRLDDSLVQWCAGVLHLKDTPDTHLEVLIAYTIFDWVFKLRHIFDSPIFKREITYQHFRLHSNRKLQLVRDGVCLGTSICCRMYRAFNLLCVDFRCQDQFYRVPSSNRCTTSNGAAECVLESRHCQFLGAEWWNPQNLLLAWGYWCTRFRSQRYLGQSK